MFDHIKIIKGKTHVFCGHVRYHVEFMPDGTVKCERFNSPELMALVEGKKARLIGRHSRLKGLYVQNLAKGSYTYTRDKGKALHWPATPKGKAAIKGFGLIPKKIFKKL